MTTTTQQRIDEAVQSAKAALVRQFLATPHDFFTENDLTAYFVHQLHLHLAPLNLPRMLVHCEYPTPFRCRMDGDAFVLKSGSERTAKGGLYSRGHFDITVLNPRFFDEHGADFHAIKGQDWELFQPLLHRRDATSPPIALNLFELMLIRDRKRGPRTMTAVVAEVRKDWDKAQAATAPSPNGARFAHKAEMLVFDSGLDPKTALELHDLVKPVQRRFPRLTPPDGHDSTGRGIKYGSRSGLICRESPGKA